jgi:DeoR/GlpR family transcriptional regulator of sugar metabolism
MTKKQRQEFILQCLSTQEFVKVGDIVDRLQIERTTLYRDFQELIKQGKIQEL